MRKLILFLAIVVGLALVADIWVKNKAEGEIANALDRSFAADAESTVELGGSPFIPRLLSGSIPSARVSVSSFEREGVRLSGLRMTLEDITFSWWEVVGGDIDSIEVDGGHGTAALSAADLASLFEEAGSGLTISIEGGAIQAEAGGSRSRARLSLDGNDLVLRVARLGRFSASLPAVMGGVRYHSVRVDTDRVVLEFSLRNARFDRT